MLWLKDIKKSDSNCVNVLTYGNIRMWIGIKVEILIRIRIGINTMPIHTTAPY